MSEVDGRTGGRAVDEPEAEDWAFTENPAVRALLDHVAEELAMEFVRLMRASAAPESGQGSGEEER